MGTVINTNISASNALNSLNYVVRKLKQSQTRLATGKKINNAADDVAGFSIAKKMHARSKGLGQALRNIITDKNMLSVAEGHIKNILEILTKIRTLAVQGASDAIGAEERKAINEEFSRLSKQIDFEVEQAAWGSQTLLTGTSTNSRSVSTFDFQISAGNSSNDTLNFDLFNTSNVQYEKGNFGFKTSQMGLTANADSSTATSLGPINLTQSFALAGFPNTPDGTVTINGETFTIADYSTLQEFMDDINTDGIDTSKSFTNAGFKNPPDGSGTVTIDGWTSNALSAYATVDAFMTDVYNNTGHDFEYQSSQDTFRLKKNGSLTISESGSVGFFTAANITTGTYTGGGWISSSSNVGHDANANISYDSPTDTFTIAKTSGSNLTISETGSNGFLTETNITPGTYSGSVTSSAAIGGTFSMNLSQSIANAGFAITPDGSVIINGITFTLSDYDTVQEFMDAVNNSNADAYFFFDTTYQAFYIQQKNIGSELVISESPDTAGAGFLTQANLTPGTYSSTGVTTTSSAHNLIDMIDSAIDDISNALSYIGAVMNRLSYQENSLSIAIMNTDAARSIIEDADMAFEQLQATKYKILQESSSAILAQTNMQPQYLLSLSK